MTVAQAQGFAPTALTGDGCDRWEASAYVLPLAEGVPEPRRDELGVLPHRWRGVDLARWSGAARPGAQAAPLALVNPGLAPPVRTTRTLTAAYSTLAPNARADRDRDAAGLRVVLEGGAELATAVGPPLRLGPGDLILSCRLRADDWRAGSEGVRWLDVLDLPIRSALGLLEDEGEPCAGAGRAKGEGSGRAPCRSLPWIRRWRRTERSLTAAAQRDGIRRVAPFAEGARGRPPAGVDAQVLRLEPGPRTPTVQATQSAIVVALRGEGTTVVDGWRFDWSAGDVFVIPPEAPHDFLARAQADLLIASDAPVLRAIGAWRAQRLPELQPIEHILE